MADCTPLTVDTTLYTADNTVLTADMVEICIAAVIDWLVRQRRRARR